MSWRVAGTMAEADWGVMVKMEVVEIVKVVVMVIVVVVVMEQDEDT